MVASLRVFERGIILHDIGSLGRLGGVAFSCILPVAFAAAAELEVVEVRNLKPVEASGSDALIRISAGVPHLNLVPADDEDLKPIPNELSGPLAAGCLGPDSDPDPTYRFDSAGIRFDFGYFCDDFSQKVIIKGYTEGEVQTDHVELRTHVVQISPTDPDLSLAYTVKLKLDGGKCHVETFEETTQTAGWPSEKSDLVTSETTCSVRFAQ